MSQVPTSIPVRRSRLLKVIAMCVSGLFIVAMVFLVWKWPFKRAAIIKELEGESFGKVTIASFHESYFPHPGCVLEHVIFQHNPRPGTPPLIAIDRVQIDASFEGLFTRHLKLVRVEGMHILIPPLGSEQFETPQRSSVVIDDLVADGAVLEAVSRTGGPPLKFIF